MSKTDGEKIEVMQAHVEGRCKIEESWFNQPNEWTRCSEPCWNWTVYDYRILLPTEPGAALNWWEARECCRRGIKIEVNPSAGAFIPDACEVNLVSRAFTYRLPPAKEQVWPVVGSYEWAVEQIKAGRKLQYWDDADAIWCDSEANITGAGTSYLGKGNTYRLKPEPTYRYLCAADVTPGSVFTDKKLSVIEFQPVAKTSDVVVFCDSNKPFTIHYVVLRDDWLWKPGGVGDWQECKVEVEV